MTQNFRTKEIIRMLHDNVTLETTKLSEMFGVSPVTIRRDFEHLEKEGFLTTIYGGAIANRTIPDLHVAENESQQRILEKRNIAKAAAEFVKPGQTIFLDSGSTVKELAIELLTKSDITVLTHSILALNVLTQASNNIRLIAVPGQFQKNSMCFFGAMTMDFLEMVHVDYAFIGVSGFSYEKGGTTANPDEAYAKRKMASVADKTVVLADRWKMGNDSVFTAVTLSDIDVLITGIQEDDEQIEKIKQSGVNVINVYK